MKFLALLLALLLAGCAAQPTPTTEATAADALYTPGHRLETQTSGMMQVFPTETSGFCRIWAMGEDVLLSGDGKLTCLSGASLTPGSTRQADTVLQTGSDGVWLFDGSAVQILDGSFALLQTVTIPDEVLGVPGLEGSQLYYLSEGCLKVLDLSTGLSSLLRDNMAFTDGTVQCLGDLLLLHMTDEDGIGKTLLVSAADGSTQYPSLAVADACRFETGLGILLEDGQVLLLPDSGGAQKLTLEEGEQMVGFLPEIGGLITCRNDTAGLTLRLYALSRGILRCSVLLPEVDLVGTGCVSADGTLYISAHSTQETAWWILRWNYEAFPPVSEDSCLEPYYTRDFLDVQASCETLARELGAQYGISVLLFDEAAACAPWDYSFTAEYRVDKTNWALEDLKATLEAFPEGFLTKLRQDWEDLTVCIVDTIQGTAESGSLDSAEGLQFQNGSHFYIALAPKEEDSLKHTLFHEFSHLIDNRVLTKTGAYDNWNDLNPQDFAYSLDLNADMTPYKALLTGPDRVFIDNYAMTFPAEDRARIFECACTSGNEEDFVSPILQAKLQRICTGIRQAFDLEADAESFLWEQYLTLAR
jgi:hypothetical protein